MRCIIKSSRIIPLMFLLSAAGCATAPPPPRPAADPVRLSSSPQPALADSPATSKAVLAPHLDEQLQWLKRSHEQGHLTDKEYHQARDAAVSVLGEGWVSPATADSKDTKWLHDELDYLADMQHRGVISASEFEICRSDIVWRYLQAMKAQAS